MSDKDNTDDKTAQDAPLTDEEAQSVQGGRRQGDPSASSALLASEAVAKES
ncbi:MAG: hypothetical protein U0990_00385 [Candidatus Nanopelagicales bacterium]|nr:hypothetical protein [Candidatus Nanopelagicales bacterium]MDZ4248531.1 hypothetical protein [Candidatus Nanopelagicales bacterium]MDZ7577309.1 hypothetical protein [Candidatus Nanopelagicales bacterium]